MLIEKRYFYFNINNASLLLIIQKYTIARPTLQTRLKILQYLLHKLIDNTVGDKFKNLPSFSCSILYNV